ncbi:enoyl-CoA hydratase/isomerase family protein [Bacillus piscicola]|uniref:enoyl-CoA hydratase/isomerase family protein n=1 Tax=Bacillus piscicola TaxID=1632684 RepID=UPI001F08B7F8|nr:enoyl-CoA hydratase/isomerase family protein [Bacillus piscicola]
MEGATTNSSVIFKKTNKVGWIKLNRPKALNSLNYEMVKSILLTLEEWKNDDEIVTVCISGEGEKGFCAGGDMRALYEAKGSNNSQAAFNFFSTEYKMNLLLHHYPKPTITFMNGVVMGGGVGISEGTTYRIVNEKTKWSMPEMNIGFFPDVGASYFLNNMPGYTGRYLALSSPVLRVEDIVYVGAAEYLVSKDKWPEMVWEIENAEWDKEEADEIIKSIIQKVSESAGESQLKSVQDKIDKHFQFNSIKEIIDSLSREQDDEWAQNTLQALKEKSSLSLKTTLEQLLRGTTQSVMECFQMEFNLSMNFMKNPDFYEGVRSVLVDKDRNPQWTYKNLTDVSDSKVNDMFVYGDNHNHPLENWDDKLSISKMSQ